jgi:hypothetical protein
MAKIVDPKTGEFLGYTADDPMYTPDTPANPSNRFTVKQYDAATSLDKAEMGMVGSQTPSAPSQKWTDEYGTVWSSKPPTAGVVTVEDDYGNKLTFDRENPNPEVAAAVNPSSYGNDPPVSPDPNYQADAAASDAGNLGSLSDNANTSQSNIDQAVANSGDLSFGGNALTGNQDAINRAVADSGDLTFGSSALTNSVSSSLGGVTDTGKMFSAATDAAGSAASSGLSSVLNSVPSGQLSDVLGGLPGLGPSIGNLAKMGNIAGLAGALSKGLSPTALTNLATGIALSNVSNIVKGLGGQVGSVLQIGDKLANASGHAQNIANFAAANSGFPTSVVVNGVTQTVQPPARPMDLVMKAKGTPMDVVPPEGRAVANNIQKMMRTNGTLNGDTADEGAAIGPGIPTSAIRQSFGQARDLRGMVPSMESLLFDVPGSVLKKLTSGLPSTFQSLLPGAALGVVGALTKSGPVSLGGLTQLVGGAALGSVAGQALRSVGGIGAVSGMSGVLGAQSIARTVGSGAIPVNIASTFANSIVSQQVGSLAGNVASDVFGSSPNTAAVVSNVVGIVSNVALNKNISGIPVSSQVLGLAANVALKSAGVSVGIPTSVLGVSANIVNNPLASVMGSLVSGRVPVIPTNLSLGNVGALSGLTQVLGPDLADNIIPRSQLGGLLPPNLSNQIKSSVPPRMRSPGVRNEMEDRNISAPAKVSDAELQPKTGTPPQTNAPMLNGTVNGQIPYEAKVSKYFTLGELSIGAKAGSHRIVPQNGLSVDQIIKGLSWMAVNVLDPLRDAGFKFQINSGFRGPGGTNPGGDHGRGAAVDIKAGNRSENMKMATYVRQNSLPVGQMILESNVSAGWDWLHVAGGTGHPTAKNPKTNSSNTSTFTGGAPYQEGLWLSPNGPRQMV